MQNSPIFSIITSTFNRCHTLHRVYASLATQTYTRFEWIVVDDGSTDNTREQIAQWQEEAHFCIHYIYKENGGKTSALILAIPKVVGELILIADSDDAFLPQSLEVFHTAWQALSPEQKQHCNGIYALCQTQKGAHVGENYASEGIFDPKRFHFGGEIGRVGENWFAMNAAMMRKHFVLSESEQQLGFIPESHFWNKIILQERPFGVRLNQRLRIYYTNEEEPSLSVGIRQKAALGFWFESRDVLNHDALLLWRYPRFLGKHLLKYILFVQYLGRGFCRGFCELDSLPVRLMFALCYPLGFVLRKHYFGKGTA
ncbi:MAG: glycosyltransferase family 2 protein [Helicobacter sp.]|nr:glycosyltransferase family 2 protein [Helicobacter sp.]